LTSLASTQSCSFSGRCSPKFLRLCSVQRWITACAPNTSRTAADSALAPSSTTSSPSERSFRRIKGYKQMPQLVEALYRHAHPETAAAADTVGAAA
jgi:hypothetical protein